LEVARSLIDDFTDGVYFVALAPLEDATLIAPGMIQALSLAETKDCSAIEQLIDGIGDRKVLIVMDNCEHLIDEAARQVVELLSACPGLKILATSREALRVPGEWLFTLTPLPTPAKSETINLASAVEYPALILFSERARAVRSDFELNQGNLQTVATICSRLDGLPLAIELIAARIRFMSAKTLLERMTDQFVLSADGMRGVTARQKTLQNAIRWSYDLLSANEKMVFARLAVFTGGFTLPASEEILREVNLDVPAVDMVASLLDKSLLYCSFDEKDEPRFSMLYTIQQFALKCLREMGIESGVRDRHLAYYLDLAEKADREMHGPAQAEWIRSVENESDNLRAAMEWCLRQKYTEKGLCLLGALGWPWEVRSHYREMRNSFEKFRVLPDVKNYPAAYGILLSHVGRQIWTQGNWEDAKELLEEGRETWLGIGEQGEQGLAEALNWLALVAHYNENDSYKAENYLQHSRELFQKCLNPREALSIFHLGILESDRGHYPEARAYFEQSLELFQRIGDLFFIARVSTYLGELFRKLGDLEMSRRCFEQHLTIDLQLQFWDGISDALNSLGNITRQQGDIENAESYFEQSRQICREHGLIEKQPY
jgi:predicted ATPase